MKLFENVTLIERAVSEEEKTYLLQRAVALLFLSNQKTEAFGITQLEAAKHGLPIVNFNLLTGVTEVGVDGITSMTLPINDYAKLADILASSSLDDFFDFYEDEKVESFLKENFSKEKSSALLSEIYKSARS